MKWIILPIALLALSVSSCTKESSLSTPAIVAASSSNSGLDDVGFDDHGNHSGRDDKGGNVASGGGQNISAASVPTAVKTAFKARYPTASSIEWKKLSNGNYKAQFWFKNLRFEATFSAAGKLLKEERR
jgi:hypothetical protein